MAKASIENKIKKAILLSTDKAVYPINSMGMTKALAEKIFVAKSMDNHKTKLVNIRYGNVIASRGSIVPRFLEQARNGDKHSNKQTNVVLQCLWKMRLNF